MSIQSIAHLFFEACETFDKPDAVLIKREGAYGPVSHKFFRQRVSDFGRGLIAAGLALGEHVAIQAETRFEWAIADLGIISAGGVVVPVYPTLTAEESAYILEHADAVGVVVSTAEQAEKVIAIRAGLPKLRFVIQMDDEPLADDVRAMSEVDISGSRRDNETELHRRWQAMTRADLLTLIYTSGTTGHPKGVMLTHGNLLANLESCEPYMPFGPDDIHLAHLPLSHSFERMAGHYSMIWRGVTIAYAEDIKKVPDNIREVRPTLLISVPRLYEKIHAKILARGVQAGFLKRGVFNWALSVARKAAPQLNQDKPLRGFLKHEWNMADRLVFSKIREGTGGRLRYMSSGGAPLAKEIAELFLGLNMKLLEGYGLTETSPVLAVNRPDWNKPGTVGPAVDDVEIRIAEDGEILARGPNVMQGYYKDPEATAAALVDGWFHTGDIGQLDGDGFLRITDRKKDLLITSGGKNVAPQPLENALKLSPLIEQAVVIGDRRNFITALLVPPYETIEEWAPPRGWPTDPAALLTDQGFRAAIEAEVTAQMKPFANYERVKKFEILPAPFTIEKGELTPSLKVRRKNVIARYEAAIDGLYTD